jgi:hypothetical protein
MKHLGRFLVAGAAVVLLSLSASPASANPAPTELDSIVNLALGGRGTDLEPAAAQCELYATKPNYSGGVITGTGGFKSCSVPPVACAFDVTLQLYLPGPGTWADAAESGRKYLCPPPLRSASASVRDCEIQPVQYAYRTQTTGSISDEDGHASGVAYSPILYLSCL